MERQGRTPATSKGAATRAHIVHAAASCFARGGFAGTPLSELIAASGLTRGAFYFHFPSKEALAEAVLRDQRRRMLGEVRERVQQHETGVGQLRELPRAVLDVHAAQPSAWSAGRLAGELAELRGLAAQVREPMREWIEFVADVFRQCRVDGTLRPGVDPEQLAVVMVGAFDGVKAITDLLDGDEGQHDPTPHLMRVLRERTAVLMDLIESTLVPEARLSGPE